MADDATDTGVSTETGEELETVIEEKVVTLIINYTIRLVSDITSVIETNFNQIINDSVAIDQYFDEIYSQYANDLVSFLNLDLWNEIATADRIKVNGIITIYSIDESYNFPDSDNIH